MSVSNSVFSRLIAINAWTITALNIIGLLGPAIKVLDSWVVSIGQVRVSLLTLIKVGLSLWLALWLANGLATLVEKKLEKIDFSGPATRVLGAKLIRLLLITFAKK